MADEEEDLEFDDDFEIEVIDDTPEEDRVPKRDPEAVGDEDFDDDPDELGNINEKTKKRINRLRYEFHEQRREREAAERERDAAIEYAKKARDYAEKTRKNLVTGEKVLLSEIKQRSEKTLEMAKAKARAAFEEGDGEAYIAAQQEITQALLEKQQVESYQPPVDREMPEYQPNQQPRMVYPVKEKWLASNKWFDKDKAKTVYAKTYAAQLEQSGIDPLKDPEKYYSMIDQEMRSVFPEMKQVERDNGATEPSVNAKPQPVVVAGKRTSASSRNSKVQLTATERRIAKRFGLTDKQYAIEKMRLEKADADRAGR